MASSRFKVLLTAFIFLAVVFYSGAAMQIWTDVQLRAQTRGPAPATTPIGRARQKSAQDEIANPGGGGGGVVGGGGIIGGQGGMQQGSYGGTTSESQGTPAPSPLVITQKLLGTIIPGTAGSIRYQITVTNTGTATAKDVYMVNYRSLKPLTFLQSSPTTNKGCSLLENGKDVICYDDTTHRPFDLTPKGTAGSSRTFTLTYSVPASLTCPYEENNAVAARGSNATSAGASQMIMFFCPTSPSSAAAVQTGTAASSAISVPSGSPLVVTQTLLGQMVPGNNVRYQVQITNQSTTKAVDGVYFVDYRGSKDLTFVPHSSSTSLGYTSDAGCSLLENGKDVICYDGTANRPFSIPALTARTFTIVYRVSSVLSCPFTVSNTMVARGSNAAVNSTTMEVPLRCVNSTDSSNVINSTPPSLVITQAFLSRMVPGSTVRYKVTVTNIGGPTNGLYFVDYRGSNDLIFVPHSNSSTNVTSDAGCSLLENGRDVICYDGMNLPFELGSFASRTFTIAYSVPTTLSCSSMVTNTVAARGNNAPVASMALQIPVSCTNTSTPTASGVANTVASSAKSSAAVTNTAATTSSSSAPSLIVTQKLLDRMIPGAIAHYQITITNTGTATANGVYFVDYRQNKNTTFLPYSSSPNAGSDRGCTLLDNGRDVICYDSSTHLPFNLSAAGSTGNSRTFTIAYSVPTTLSCSSMVTNTVAARGNNAPVASMALQIPVSCQ